MAASRGACLCVTPELALTGYPPRDLLLSKAFVDQAAQEMQRLAEALQGGPAVLIGNATWAGAGQGRPLSNCAVLLRDGGVTAHFSKRLLPTYDVFDEDRYFEPGQSLGYFDYGGKRLGVTICEDIWNDKDFWRVRRYASDPLEPLAGAKLSAVLNLSASPFTLGKQAVREAMLGNTARKYGLPVLYCNQVGGNDDLVFDGRSLAVDANGHVAARGAAFREDVVVVDLESLAGPGLADGPPRALEGAAHQALGEEDEALGALELGVKDYAAKCGFKGAILGLSGGIDSALTAVIAAKALGAQNVLGVMLPSPHSSRGSIEDSERLAANLGIRALTLPIGPLMATFDAALAGAFAGCAQDVTEENIQSRIRGNLLMALSNKFGLLLLTTGNKSELAVGYCTIYGDMSGGLAVIADVPKTMVYRLSRRINGNSGGREIIPRAVLEKAPSAELRPDQKDQDSLPPYDILDAVLRLRVEEHRSQEEIVAAGFDRSMVEKVCGLVKGAEFKRRQAAPGIKITDRAFGSGWRMPVACRIPY